MLVSIIWYLLVGLVVGWLAGVLVQGRGFGVAVDIIVGIIGAVIGGWLGGFLGLTPDSRLGGLILSVIGALILVAIVKAVRRA